MRRHLQTMTLTEALRGARGPFWFDTTLQDIRFALRTVRKSPGFAITAICTLAMGIGANTAIFSVVSGVLLRPLPFRDPDRLVQVNEKKTVPPFEIGTVAYPDLEDFRKQSTSFQAMVAYNTGSKNVQNAADRARIVTTAAERGLFRMLGVEPIAGRTFRDDDPPNVVVIGAGFWERHFAGDPLLIGKKITLDGEGFTVIGVMPEGFQFPYQASPLPGATSELHTELWIPWEESPQWAHNRNVHVEFVAGLLKPGVGLDGANTELGVIAKRLEAQYPETNSGRGVRIVPLAEVVAGRVRTSLLVLLGAAGMVLLVACANVANLLLARAAARTREVAIRAALGAAGLRLMRQFLTESILLALGGGLVGLAIAAWGTHVLLKLAAAQIPRSWEIGLDWRVFAFLLVVCVVTGVGFGLAPAIPFGLWVKSDFLRGLGAVYLVIVAGGLLWPVVSSNFVLDRLPLAALYIFLAGINLLIAGILLLSKQFAIEWAKERDQQPKYKRYLRLGLLYGLVGAALIATFNDIVNLASK